MGRLQGETDRELHLRASQLAASAPMIVAAGDIIRLLNASINDSHRADVAEARLSTVLTQIAEARSEDVFIPAGLPDAVDVSQPAG